MLPPPTASEQELLAATLERGGKPLDSRERFSACLVGAAFLVAVALLFLLRPPDAFPLLPAAVCVLVLALATQVHFHVASGYTVPTQLAFVPLLFAVPVAVAPVAVALSVVLGRLPGVIAGKTRAGRLAHSIGNSWFAIGPAAVFAAFDVAPAEATLALLLLALAAQFAADFAASTVREAIESGMPLREQIREAWVYGVDAAFSPVGLTVAHEIDSRPGLVLGLIPMFGVLTVFARERRGRLENLVELKNAYQGTALVLGDVVEADDSYTAEHSRGVVRLALDVGERLGLDGEHLRNLEFGALLHDVGKVAIPKEIINKPESLDTDEWTVIRTHSAEGQRMLEQVGGFMRDVGMIVRHHHERWDGAGYPDGLAGEEIPVESRIIACCDTWNAMRTDRPYRKALLHEHAVAELVISTGRALDPLITQTLLAVVGESEQAEGGTFGSGRFPIVAAG